MIFTRIKRFFIGEPLSNQAASGEKLSKKRALAILSSDALSSVAYATEEMLIPLLLISMAAMTWSVPVAIAIATLLVIVTVSYRQTIESYPNGGGAYIVAKENLGIFPGLIAGASLLIDYILTVAVSVAAGVAALTSAFPALTTHQVTISIVIVLMIMVMNLRGIRESSTVFSVPTYFFIFSILTLIVCGGWKILTGEAPMVAPLIHETYPEISIFLVFKAFSSGCAALTGIEAISNGVTAFRPPEAKNAKATMAWMSIILAVLFLGVTLLVHVYGIHPVVEGPHETVVSLLAKSVFGTGFFYYAIQFSTTMILVLAANTSYTGFPVLASLLAKDRFLPRQLANIGDKLVFSNGIMGLSFVAVFLLIFFQASTHRLIPLYAIGVFLSFTLSQAGMVVHHFRGKRPGWLRALVFNGIGAAATLIVLLVISTSKFLAGAWIVLLLIPALVYFFFTIHRHYLAVGKELSLVGVTPPKKLEPLKHTVIIPISGIHKGVIDALRYAISISQDVRACYVEWDPDVTERMQEEWKKWAHEIPFVVLKSPYRSIISPVIDYINDVEKVTGNEMITVIIPEFVTAKWTNRLLHNQTALLIRAALSLYRRKVVISVRYHLVKT